MVRITTITFVIFHTMIIYGSFLEALCAICLDTPNTVLKPCGHVLCEECASQILSSGCPLCREPITDVQPLSPEETRLVQSLRAESDYSDELQRKKRIDGDSDLIVEKFCSKWKKDKHLIAAELLKRIAMKNLENFNTFQQALKQTMRDGHRILMQKKETEKERNLRRLMYWNNFELRSKDSSKKYLEHRPQVETLIALIPKEQEKNRARELLVSEITQACVDLKKKMNSGINSGKIKLNDLEDQNHVIWQHFFEGCLNVETKIYERFLKGKRLSDKNAQILEDLRKDTEGLCFKLNMHLSLSASVSVKTDDSCLEIIENNPATGIKDSCMQFTESESVKTDDNCLKIIENEPATGLCNRVCKTIIRTLCNRHAKFD